MESRKLNPILDNLKVLLYCFVMSENRDRMYRIRTYKKKCTSNPVFLKSESGNEILVGMHNSDIMPALHPSWEDSVSFSFLRKLKNVPQWGRTFIWKQPAYVWLSEKSGAAGWTNFCYIRNLKKWQFGQYQKLNICKFLSCLKLISKVVLLKLTNLSLLL